MNLKRVIKLKIEGPGGIDPLKAYASQYKQKEKAEEVKTISEAAQNDTLEISPEARQMQLYKRALEELPAVRDDLVASLKQKILEGTYKPDSEKIANGIIEEKHIDKFV